ncbi:MAG: PIN domain-containing protein [Planctomycetota bacterium]|jgi:hypothetical protein
MNERAALTKTSENKGKNPLGTKPKENFYESMDSPVEQIFHLQRTIGNQAIQRMIKSGTLQAKLKIDKPNDKYEQEADRVADKVMSMPEPKGSLVNSHRSLAEQVTPLIQRQEESENEEIRAKPFTEGIIHSIQRETVPVEEEVQAKQTYNKTPTFKPSSSSDVIQLKSSKKEQTFVSRFRGPSGRLLDPSVVKNLRRRKTVRHIAIGGAWPEGYPLVPNVYDGFLNFTFVADSVNSVVVHREGNYFEIPVNNIRGYVRFTPIEKGVWSARWIAIAYPGGIKLAGEILMMMGGVFTLIGMLMFRIGEEGLREASEAGISEARELMEEQDKETEFIRVLGTVERCNLDTSALIDLEKHGGIRAREMGTQGKLFTTQYAKKEFKRKGNWTKLQRRFNIKVLKKGANYNSLFKRIRTLGLKVGDAHVLAGSRAHNLTLVTANPADFREAAQKLKINIRAYYPYMRGYGRVPSEPRRIPPLSKVPRFLPRK